MRKPRALKPGDRIAIVAPASPFNRDEFARGVAEIERLGFVPMFEDSVFEKDSSYLAGSPEVRAAAFMKHWTDPSVSALLAVRGGYGSVHLLPLLDRARIIEQPKLFIGYSDNTSLLSWLTCQCGITALHGPMIEGRLAGGAGYDQRSFLELLTGGRRLELAPEGLTVLREGEVSGPLFGGTITQLVASLGTPFAFDPPDGCVLFLEEVNERPYRIDRMLTQLALSGLLARARALVFGEMRGCDEPGGAVTAIDAIARTTRDCAGPMSVGFPSGHTTGPDVDAAARCTRVRLDSAQDQPFSSRTHPLSDREADPSDRRLRHGDGHARGAAQESRARRPGLGSELYPPMSDFLVEQGIRTFSGYGRDHITSDIDLVVVGNAISRGNAELESVLERKVRTVRCPKPSGTTFSGAHAQS